MALTRPLAVAAAAAVLLVLVVGADASMDRSLHVDRRDADGAWATLVSGGEVAPEERYLAYPDATVHVADRNDSLTMRVRVENGYPWGYGEEYVAYAQGVEVARGRLAADARASGTAEFAVPVQRLVGGALGKPVPQDDAPPLTHHGFIEVRIGGQTLHAGLQVEVAQ